MNNLTDEQINATIADFESQLFANMPSFETKEEYDAQCTWVADRKPIANNFKALLVAGELEQAENIYNQYAQ